MYFQFDHNKEKAPLGLLLVLLSVLLFVFFTTGSKSGFLGFYISLLISIVYLFAYFFDKKKHTLYLYIGSVLIGFLSFHLFRLNGLVVWPMNYARDISSYLWLLYWHAILSISVLVPLFISHYLLTGIPISLNNINFQFSSLMKNKKDNYAINISLIISLLSWIIAFSIIFLNNSSKSISIAFLSICIVKAFINSITEEIVFRGFIQSSSLEFLGISQGIIFQSIIYTLFHVFLGPGDIHGILFIIIVFFIGIILGTLTYFNKSILFPIIIHASIDVVVEWTNLL